jgi:hypothetical protein
VCDTNKCSACRPERKLGFWYVVGHLVAGIAVVLWHLIRKVLAPATIALGWCAYVWFTGRTWRHQVRHRIVRREVRAAGNWLLTATAAALVWQPVATAVVLAVLGASLVGAALGMRHRERLRELWAPRRQLEPRRVEAIVGEPIRDWEVVRRGA